MTNLKSLREKKGVSQQAVADYLEITRQAYSNYENGKRQADYETLLKLGEFFNVSIDYLLNKEKEPLKNERLSIDNIPNEIPYSSARYAPILGTIPAGAPILAVEDIEGYATVPYNDDADYFYLRVNGESMKGAGIQTGDLVLIRRQPCADDGQIVACRVNGDEATLKRYKRQGNTVLLLPENPDFEPRIVPISDFESGAAEIIGVAVEFRRML